MIKSKAINKTALLFSVSALLISLFTSTVSLASAGQQSFNGYGYGNGGSFKSGSSPFLISPQALVVAVTVPLAGCAYFWLQSQWNNKEDLLEIPKDKSPSENGLSADMDREIDKQKEEEKRRDEKSKNAFLNSQGQGSDKKYEGEKSWSLNEEERAGGVAGLVRENTDFSNQHDRFNAQGNFYGVDLLGEVKDLDPKQMPEGINKAVTSVKIRGETIVWVKSMDGLRSLVESAKVRGKGKAASGLTRTKKIRLKLAFDDFEKSDDIGKTKEMIAQLLKKDRLIGLHCQLDSKFHNTGIKKRWHSDDVVREKIETGERHMAMVLEALIENLEVDTPLQELFFNYFATNFSSDLLSVKGIDRLIDKVAAISSIKIFEVSIMNSDDYMDEIRVGNCTSPPGFRVGTDVEAFFRVSMRDPGFDAAAVNKVMEFLKMNPVITGVEFVCEPIDLEKAVVMFDALRESKTIRWLSIGSRASVVIEDKEVWRAFFEMMKVNNSIKKLVIASARMDLEECKLFVDMLKVNTSLVQAHLKIDPKIVKEIGQLLHVNNFLQENYSHLVEKEQRIVKSIMVSYLDKLFVETGKRVVVEEGPMREYIEQEIVELKKIGFIKSAELAINGCEGDGVEMFAGKSKEEMAEEAAEDFLTSFYTVSDRRKKYMAQKMFHIYQVLAETFTKDSVEMQEAREKSMVYLVYSYGLKLALSEVGAEKVIGVEDDVDLDMEVLLKAVVVENLRGGKGGLLYEQFLKDEKTRLKAVSYLRRKIIKHDSWLTEERKRWMMGVVLHLFGEELLEEVSKFKQGDIDEIKKTLVSLNRRRESKEWDIRSVESYVKGLREQKENAAKQETKEKIDNEIEEREGKIGRLKQKLSNIEQEIEEVSGDIAGREQSLEVFNALSNLSEVDGQYFKFLKILSKVNNRGDASDKVKDAARRLKKFADKLLKY